VVTGGGYKYLQLGEGNAFLRLPRALDVRPALTGWFAEFSTKSAASGWERVEYGAGAAAFAGSTYDPVSHYRGARVFDFFAEQGLRPALLREVSQHQVRLLARRFDELALPEEVLTRDRSVPLDQFAAFLSLESPYAPDLSRRLLERGVFTDARHRCLRLGPAPYLCDAQLETAMAILGDVATRL
jgi:kynureninase